MKCGWPKPKQGVRGRRQDPSALIHPNNPCFTVKSGRSQATWWPALYTDCGLPHHGASPRPCEASVSTVPRGQPHSGAKGGSKRQEGVGGFGEQSSAGTLFCSPLELFYEACSHSSELIIQMDDFESGRMLCTSYPGTVNLPRVSQANQSIGLLFWSEFCSSQKKNL